MGTVLVKPQGFQKLTLTDEALEKWLKALQIGAPKAETLPLRAALGRVLVEDLVAIESLPRFDRSAMDGYALKAIDTVGTSQSKPAMLEVTENQEILSKQARQIWTGNPIPRGADAVVIIENTEKKGNNLLVYSPVTPALNIAKIGEDIKEGSLIASAGTRLNPYHLGLAAALGFSQLKVAAKPKIGVLATGNELAEVGIPLSGNLIYDSNKVMVSGVCHELGAETADLGIVKDNVDEISAKILVAIKTYDAVITTGGTSVGGLDLVPDAVNKLGQPGVLVHGVALRPAMPTALAVLEGKPVLILSGNPVAAIIGFEVFGRSLICKMLGMTETESAAHVESHIRLGMFQAHLEEKPMFEYM